MINPTKYTAQVVNGKNYLSTFSCFPWFLIPMTTMQNIRGYFLSSCNSRKRFFHKSPPLDEGNSSNSMRGLLWRKVLHMYNFWLTRNQSQVIQKSSQCVLRIQMWSQNTITNRNHFIIISTRKSIEYLEILDDSRIIFQPWNWSVLLGWTLIRAVVRFENLRGRNNVEGIICPWLVLPG